jgi:hypothetical protein
LQIGLLLIALATPEVQTAMTPRFKKLIGTVVMLVWLAVYALIAMDVGVRVLPHAGGFVRFLYYALAGTLWIIPVGLMLPWMHREPKKPAP